MSKFKTYYTNIGMHKGTIHKEESVTNQSQAADVDIYKCIEKYGINSLIRKTMAEEEMYLDNTGTMNLTLDEALRQKEQMTEYFKQMPANARKVFGDNPDTFIEKYKSGQFNDFLTTGALNEEQINTIISERADADAKLKTKLKEEIKKELQTENNNQHAGAIINYDKGETNET